jgi:hypothetical protein
MDTLLLIIIAIILLIITLLFCKKSEYESFSNQNTETKTKNDTSYLYPIKKLGSICEKEGLKASYMPKGCYVDGKMNSYANCKCEDSKGNCKICYPTIKKDSKNSSVIYNAEKLS